MRGPLSTLLAGVLLTMVSLTFGAGTLLVAGAGLVVLALFGPTWVLLASLSVSAQRELQRQRLQEGELLRADLTVRRRLPLRLRVAIEDPGLAPNPVEVTLGAARTRLRLQASFPRRGRVQLPPSQVWVSDPLSLCRVVRRAGARSEVLVLPALLPISWTGSRTMGERPSDAERAGHEPPAALEVDGVRPYRPGTPASRIHWPSLARAGGLMERRLRADGDELPLVLLDPASPAGAGELDAAVRAAASLAVELARRGGCRVMIAGEERPSTLRRDLAGWDAVHAALALVQADPRRGAGALRPPGGGTLLLVCGAWPQAVSAEAARVMVIVPSHLAPAGSAPKLRVAGCVGISRRGEVAA